MRMNTGLHGIRTLATWLVRTLATRTVGTDNKNTWHKNNNTHGTRTTGHMAQRTTEHLALIIVTCGTKMARALDVVTLTVRTLRI